MAVPKTSDFPRYTNKNLTGNNWNTLVQSIVDMVTNGISDFTIGSLVADSVIADLTGSTGFPSSDISIVAGESISEGNLIRQSGTQAFKATNASDAGITGILGFSLTTVTTGDTLQYRKIGLYEDLSGLTPGSTYYVGTSGAITSSKPSSRAVPIGLAISSTTISISIPFSELSPTFPYLNTTGQLTSSVTTGTSPFVVASTTKVANLNADYLDDQTGSYYQNADNINAGTLVIGRGGTGTTSTPSNGNLLIGNGTGYTISSLTGTSNQITVTNGSGSITLSTPQNIGTSSSPTFGGLTLTGQLTSSVTTGTSPFVVASTTKVANLNADYLDDQTGSYYQNADNMNAGTLPSGRLTGSYTGITGLGTLGSLAVSGSSVFSGGTLNSWGTPFTPVVQIGSTLGLSVLSTDGTPLMLFNTYFDGSNYKYAYGTSKYAGIFYFEPGAGSLIYTNTSSAGNAGGTASMSDIFTLSRTGKITQSLSAGGEVNLKTISSDTGIFSRFYNNSNTGNAAYGIENSAGNTIFSGSDPYAFCFFVPSGRAFNWIIDTTRILKLNSTGLGFGSATITGKINLADHTTAAGGIYIGSDVTLYRSSASVATFGSSLVCLGLNCGQITCAGGGANVIETTGDSVVATLAKASNVAYTNTVFLANASAMADSSTYNLIRASNTSGTRMTLRGDGHIFFQAHNTTASAANAFLDSSTGELSRSTSALKYKMDVKDAENTSDLYKLRPVTYRSAIEGDNQDIRYFGFIGDEVKEIIPELVYYNPKTGDVEGLQYDRITVLLVSEIKKLKESIDYLKSKAYVET